MTASSVSRSAIEQSISAAEAYFQSNDLARAEAILLRLTERAPGEAAAYELHGQVLLARAAEARAQGDHAGSERLARDAYERYRKAIEHSLPSAGLHHSAGDIAIMAGLSDSALEHYLEAMRLDPSSSRHAVFAAQLLAEAQQYDEAEDALRRALEIDPDEPIAHASLANIAMQLGRFDEAIEHVREARAIRPGDVSLRVVEAAIHRRAGDPDRAIQLLAGLSQHQLAQLAVASELAASYAAIGRHEAAAEMWANSFRLRPNDADAWKAALAAAEQYLEAGKRTDARLWLEEARLAATVAGSRSAIERVDEVEGRIGGQRSNS